MKAWNGCQGCLVEYGWIGCQRCLVEYGWIWCQGCLVEYGYGTAVNFVGLAPNQTIFLIYFSLKENWKFFNFIFD